MPPPTAERHRLAYALIQAPRERDDARHDLQITRADLDNALHELAHAKHAIDALRTQHDACPRCHP